MWGDTTLLRPSPPSGPFYWPSLPFSEPFCWLSPFLGGLFIGLLFSLFKGFLLGLFFFFLCLYYGLLLFLGFLTGFLLSLFTGFLLGLFSGLFFFLCLYYGLLLFLGFLTGLLLSLFTGFLLDLFYGLVFWDFSLASSFFWVIWQAFSSFSSPSVCWNSFCRMVSKQTKKNRDVTFNTYVWVSLRMSTPRMSTPRMSTPKTSSSQKCQLPLCQLPKCHLSNFFFRITSELIWLKSSWTSNSIKVTYHGVQ